MVEQPLLLQRIDDTYWHKDPRPGRMISAPRERNTGAAGWMTGERWSAHTKPGPHPLRFRFHSSILGPTLSLSGCGDGTPFT